MIERPAHPAPSLLFANISVDDIRRLATLADSAGARRAWLAETNTVDVATAAGLIAATTRLELGSAILSAFTRTPATVAMMASSVAETSGRPFHLGIGAGGQAIVERWNGLAYRQTVDRVRDFIAIVRTALAGQRTDYTGTVLSSHGFALVRPPAVPIPIYIGAIGERMIDLATETADGLILSWASPRMAAAELASARGLVGAHGRDPAAFRVVGRMYGCVTTDVDGTREMVRQELVAYLASPPYGRYFTRHGFEAEVDAVKRAFADGDRRRSAAAVSDRMLDELLSVGSEAQIREKAEAYWAAGIDDLMVQLVPVGGPATAEATIRAVL